MPFSCSSLLLAVVSAVASIAPLPLLSAAASAVGSAENAVQLSAATRGRRGGEKRGLRLKGDEEKKESLNLCGGSECVFLFMGCTLGLPHMSSCAVSHGRDMLTLDSSAIRVIFLNYS